MTESIFRRYTNKKPSILVKVERGDITAFTKENIWVKGLHFCTGLVIYNPLTDSVAAGHDSPLLGEKAEGKFVRQSGGRGQYGHVLLRLEPQESGKGYEFVNEIVGGAVPKEYIPAVDKGIREQMANGVIAGYPVVDVKVTLYDGSYHDVDSSEMAFKIAGSMGFKEGATKANPVLLEPMMNVEVVTPEDYLGAVTITGSGTTDVDIVNYSTNADLTLAGSAGNPTS